MFLAGGYEFGAHLLGVSLYTYGSIHRTFAYVALLEGIVHVIIIARTKALSWSNHSDFYGLLVCFLPLFLNKLNSSEVLGIMYTLSAHRVTTSQEESI